VAAAPADGSAPPPDRFALALQARVRDPLWMLARQWQVGEFRGEDGGSPIQATIRTESLPLTSYRPSLSGAGGALDDGTPLEAHVEREPVTLGLRGSVQLGLWFEAQLAGAHVAEFRAEYPIAAAAPPGTLPSAAAERLRTVVAGNVVDGVALLAAAAQHTADLSQVPPLPALGLAGATLVAVVAALQGLLDYRASLYSEPAQDSPWDPEELQFKFSVASDSAAGEVELDAPAFGGGHLDWYSFSLGSGTLGEVAAPPPPVQRTWSFLPQAVSFAGMPNPRWWTFEDGRTDFGRTDVQDTDLAKLLVIQFALVSGDEWFQLPLPLQIGHLSRVELLVVTDTFGVRTVIRPTAKLPMPPGAAPWQMFTLSGDPAEAGAAQAPGSDLLALMPTLGEVLDAADLEQVQFIRDETAAMAWAVEKLLQGPLDTPLDGYAPYWARLRVEASAPAAVAAHRDPTAPSIRYLAGTTVPDNWIPLLPDQTGPRSFLFRRGAMEVPDATGALQPVTARGVILEPGRSPYYLADEAVPRAGAKVSRRMRRARWTDGSTVVWMSRQARPGRGEGWSGLAFDLVEVSQDT